MSKIVNDAVHGPIDLPEWARSIIDSPPFQRLRRVRQLSFMHYVFPSAEHSRFAHSLGTMHLAGKMCRHLRLDDNQSREVMAAALLHDVGHLPFSHVIESAYRIVEAHRGRQPYEDRHPARKPQAEDALSHYCTPTQGSIHEDIGETIIDRYYRETLEQFGICADNVINIMKGNTDEQEDLVSHMIVHSAVDVDRLDYLVRDASGLGANYGLLDIDYIVRQLTRGRWKDHDVIGVRDGKEGVVDNLLLSRFFHYGQLVKNHTVVGFELAAKVLLARMIEREHDALPQFEDALYDGASTYFGSIAAFDYADDYGVMHEWQHIVAEAGDELNTALAKTLLARRRLTRLFEATWTAPGGTPREYKELTQATEQIKEIVRAEGLRKELVGWVQDEIEVEPVPEQIKDEPTKVAFVVKNGVATPAQESQSSVLALLKGTKKYVFRVYYLGDCEEHKPEIQRRITDLAQ